MAKKKTIEDMQQMARTRGGKCLSKHYIDTITKIKWQCKEGHQWTARPDKIKQGSWCPVCARNGLRHTLDDMQRMAHPRGGKCLSKHYINTNTKLKWQCKKGHQWTARPEKIKSGRWCPVCARNGLRHTLDDMQQMARKHGGKCLSKQYINGATKLKWQCKKGHQWKTPFKIIQQGCWCPVCSIVIKNAKLRGYTIEDMQRLARKRGGQCLSKRYINISTKLKWQCKEGHQWASSLKTIKQGFWCPACYRAANQSSIEDIQAIALARSGRCLSKAKDFTNIHSRVRIECDQGHRWEAIASSIVAGSWCPDCAGVRKKTLNDMQAIAHAHHGHCLTTHYENSYQKLTWQCKLGHTWTTIYRTANKTWCPVCRGRVGRKPSPSMMKYTLDTMRYVAYKRGWKVLSKRYKNTLSPLRWQCEQGHTFKMPPARVAKNSPCPVCKPRKYTLKNMQQAAKNKGGRCVSTEYVNSHTKLTWRCQQGHEWQTTPSSIVGGSWCRICAIQNRSNRN